MKKKIPQGKKIMIGFRFSLNFLHPKSHFDKNSDNQRLERALARLRSLLKALDRLNERGIMVKVAWSIGGDYSLNRVLRGLCPDILEHIKSRVAVGFDEINLSPWNESILPMLLPGEFGRTLEDAINNDHEGGLEKIFGSFEKHLVLPGGIYSPAMLPYLQNSGVESISLNLVGLYGQSYRDLTSSLTFSQSYNPLWLSRLGSRNKVVLIPSLSGVDILNRGGLKKWVMELRQKQTKSSKTGDLFLFFDEDLNSNLFFNQDKADWESGLCTIESVVESISYLPYIAFSSPSHYLKGHDANGILTLDRDILSGEEDTLIPWADKWESRKIWGMVERSRIYCELAKEMALSSGRRRVQKRVDSMIQESEDHRMIALSERYYGPDIPTLNEQHFELGLDFANQAEKSSEDAYREALSALKKRSKVISPSSFRDSLEALSSDEIVVDSDIIENNAVQLKFLGRSGTEIRFKEFGNELPVISRFAINCKGICYKGRGEIEYISTQNGVAQMLLKGKVRPKGEFKPLFWQHLYTIYAGSPYLFIDVEIDFNQVQQSTRCFELMPSEIIVPQLSGLTNKFKVWNDSPLSELENPLFTTSFFESATKGTILHSQITRSWIAYGSEGRGVLIAQKLSEDCSLSFCPVKLESRKKGVSFYLNPMGCYNSKPITRKHLSFAAKNFLNKNSRDITSSASSYLTKGLKASFMVVPFDGENLPQEYIDAALKFSRGITVPGTKDSEVKITG